MGLLYLLLTLKHKTYLRYAVLVRTAQQILSDSVMKTNPLLLCKAKVDVCSETKLTHVNTPCGRSVELLNVPAGGNRCYSKDLKG